MAKRPCSTPGCPVLSDKSRCPAHRREAERARGSRHQRGYGSDHDRLRAQWAPLVATGNVKCWRCGEYLAVNQPWDLGHRDGTDDYAGPECLGCNRATAGRSA